MYIFSQKKTVDAVNKSSCTFDFSDVINGVGSDLQINGYLIGLSSFYFSYKNKEDHDIWQFSVSLRTISSDTTQVVVGWTAVLKDKFGGNSANTGTLDITVLVVVGASGGSGHFLNFDRVRDNCFTDLSAPVSSSGVLQAQPVLRGFYLTTGSTDQRVSKVGASVACSTSTPHILGGGSAFITYDSNCDPNSTVDVGVIAVTDRTAADQFLSIGSSPLHLTQKADKYNHITPVPVSVPKTRTNHAMFLTGFYVAYPNGEKHHIQPIGATVQVDGSDGKTLSVTGQARMNDKGDQPNHQTDESYVEAVILQWDNHA